jgi:hypothetical protein
MVVPPFAAQVGALKSQLDYIKKALAQAVSSRVSLQQAMEEMSIQLVNVKQEYAELKDRTLHPPQRKM